MLRKLSQLQCRRHAFTQKFIIAYSNMSPTDGCGLSDTDNSGSKFTSITM